MQTSHSTPATRLMFILLSMLLLLAGCGHDEKHGVESVPDPKKIDGGYVSNPDHIIGEGAKQEINTLLTTLDNEGKAQVAVVLLNTIGDQVPKDFAVSLFNYWKIGSKEKDNGLLILVVKDQHRVEFETGYGLEGTLTDVMCYRIQQDYMIPSFKADAYDEAMTNGVNAVIRQLEGGDYQTENEAAPTDSTAYDTTGSQLPMQYAETTSEPAPLPEESAFSNAVAIVLDSGIFLFFYSVITFGFVFGDRVSSKRKDKAKDERKEPGFTLFINDLYQHYLFTLLVLLCGPIVLLIWWGYVYHVTEFPFYISMAAAYLSWCTFVHIYYMVILPVSARRKSAGQPCYQQHELLAKAYRNIGAFIYVFPLPFLLLVRRVYQARLKKLRDTPYICTCGKTMVRLDEFDDNKYLESGMVLEEQLHSVDYDVWLCQSCHRHLSFEYENYTSRIIRCGSCKRKTMEFVSREVVEEATTSSSGYGYKHYTCRNCKKQEKFRFTIPRKSDSSSSSSGSGSSGGSSWGGGSSGGGGAGSSW